MKTYVFIIICILFMCISCNKENDIGPLSFAAQSSDLTTQSSGSHFIGQQFGGGIIFYIDKSGQHGLIAAPEDIVEPAFWSLKDTINGAKAVALGTGSANTTKIYKTQGNPKFEADDYAALECLGLIENGYSDWYLPSKNELNKMYQYQKQIGGLQAGAYWSSSEINTTKAWFQNFSNGSQIAQIKTASYGLRAVRSF